MVGLAVAGPDVAQLCSQSRKLAVDVDFVVGSIGSEFHALSRHRASNLSNTCTKEEAQTLFGITKGTPLTPNPVVPIRLVMKPNWNLPADKSGQRTLNYWTSTSFRYDGNGLIISVGLEADRKIVEVIRRFQNALVFLLELAKRPPVTNGNKHVDDPKVFFLSLSYSVDHTDKEAFVRVRYASLSLDDARTSLWIKPEYVHTCTKV